MAAVIGVDFGTTNSVAVLRRPDGTLVPLQDGAVFRSVLCFWADQAGRTEHAAGEAAVEAHAEDPLGRRLLLSLKSHLAQRSFVETRIFARGWTLEALIGAFLRAWLAPFASDLAGARLVVGRPVRFVGEAADDALAERRLRGAFAAAGFPEIRLELEPAAAGHRFARGLDRPATVLVADFGGGTSDFSLLRFEPGPPRRVTALGHAGLGMAGDAFDYRIIDHVVSPLLGKGGSFSVMGKPLPIPPEWYSRFARWHLLSMMRAPKMLRDIAEVARTAEDPARLRNLVRLIEEDAGYALYRAVSAAKVALSRAEHAVLSFRHAGVVIEAGIARADFEAWIAPELARIEAAVASAVADVPVDRVFLTGGTSLVPAVRALFERRFGAERVAAGGEFVSVAEGLALMGVEGPGN